MRTRIGRATLVARRMAGGQRYRMRTPSTGREIIIEAEPGKIYVDRETGEELEVVGKVLPLAPVALAAALGRREPALLHWCDQLAQRDLNDCPTCGRRMAPLAS